MNFLEHKNACLLILEHLESSFRQNKSKVFLEPKIHYLIDITKSQKKNGLARSIHVLDGDINFFEFQN